MIHPRLIPCLLLKHGLLMRSQGFKVHQVIGNPINTIMRFSDWNVDELILLDISSSDYHDLRRDDLHIEYEGSTALDVLKAIAPVSFMPLAFGGRVRTLADIEIRLNLGADKVIINTQAIADPDFITQASRLFGAQCVVVSIDCKQNPDGSYEVFSQGGKQPTGLNPARWAKEAQERGAGEIFLNSIDRDGGAMGYDLELTRQVSSATSIPVITCGGVGKYEDFAAGITEGGASAVAAGNIFHFFELSYPYAKKACLDVVLPMRPIELNSPWVTREPQYTPEAAPLRIQTRMEKAAQPLPDNSPPELAEQQHLRWCKRCLYSSISAVPLEFDEEGICTGCQMQKMTVNIPASEWERRRQLLADILEQYRSKDSSNYDCVIAVSGGKDSYFITHIIKNEFGLNPLLVTYNGNNYLDVGWRNVHRMKEVFGVDHIFYSPSVQLLKKLNRLGFLITGDMNWHAHLGITTAPVRIAAQLKVPLVIWGEHGYTDLAGQFSMNDFPEMNYRDRLEYFARGFEWNYMVGLEGITAKDMLMYQYPSDQELFDLNVRGIYMSNFIPWEANRQTKLVIDRYGFEVSDESFDRTYRRMSNLDDMHENGVHDYLKYVKFGYGRATDHTCKDIRAGLMSREEGIEKVRFYDHVKPRDLTRWLDYTGMTEDEFDRIADTFRDSRVWRRVNGAWVKDEIQD